MKLNELFRRLFRKDENTGTSEDFPGPPRGRCQNCRKKWRKGDMFCWNCGALEGRAEEFQCGPVIYGPPSFQVNFACPKCRHTWKVDFPVPNSVLCPRCGHEAAETD